MVVFFPVLCVTIKISPIFWDWSFCTGYLCHISVISKDEILGTYELKVFADK